MTLNLGLRYEFQGVPKEDNNLFGNWEPSVGLEQVGKNIGSIYKGDHNNFSPRMGIAWDVTGQGTTMFASAAASIYDLLSMSTFLSQQNLQSGPCTFGLDTVPTGATIKFERSHHGSRDRKHRRHGCYNSRLAGSTGMALHWAQSHLSRQSPFQFCFGESRQRRRNPCNTFAMNRNYRSLT